MGHVCHYVLRSFDQTWDENDGYKILHYVN